MPQLRIFVSSTAYDLAAVREQLRVSIANLGHYPVLSEYADFLYDPKHHTHQACVAELKTCDIVVLILGTRFGSDARPEFVRELSSDSLAGFDSEKISKILDASSVSVTQLEALSAFQEGKPVFAFAHRDLVSEKRFYDHNEELIASGVGVKMPSGNTIEHAKYLSEFLGYIQNRTHNNAVSEFSTTGEITESLRHQLSSLLQAFLADESSSRASDQVLSGIDKKLDDVKNALIASASADTRDIVSATLRFGRVCEFMSVVGVDISNPVNDSSRSFSDAIRNSNIESIALRLRGAAARFPEALMFELKDGSYLRFRLTNSDFQRLSREWEGFTSLPGVDRKEIIQVVQDPKLSRQMSRFPMRRLSAQQAHEILDSEEVVVMPVEPALDYLGVSLGIGSDE